MVSGAAKALDELLVAPVVLALEIVEQPAALTDHHQATPGMEILLVRLQMIGQILDALGQDRDLDLGRAGVAFGLVAYSLISACLRSAVIDIESPFRLEVEHAHRA